MRFNDALELQLAAYTEARIRFLYGVGSTITWLDAVYACITFSYGDICAPSFIRWACGMPHFHRECRVCE